MMTLSVKEDVLKAAFVQMEKCCLKESVSTPLDAQVKETLLCHICCTLLYYEECYEVNADKWSAS